MIANSVVTGHNNRLFSNGSPPVNGIVLDNIAILGHNNRIENLTVRQLTVNGHNNTF